MCNCSNKRIVNCCLYVADVAVSMIMSVFHRSNCQMAYTWSSAFSKEMVLAGSLPLLPWHNVHSFVMETSASDVELVSEAFVTMEPFQCIVLNVIYASKLMMKFICQIGRQQTCNKDTLYKRKRANTVTS